MYDSGNRTTGPRVSQSKSSGKQGINFVDNRVSKQPAFQDNRVASAEVAQLQTQINHTATTVTWQGASGAVGKKMEAKLDPTDPVKGSATDSVLYTALDHKVAEFNVGKWARGHLLNHDLGGYGVPQNLYPISSGANARHAQIVEYPIKRAVSRAKKNRSDRAAGIPPVEAKPEHTGVNIHYDVEVKGTPGHSQFHCTWSYANHAFMPLGAPNKKIIASTLKDSATSSVEDPYFSAKGRPDVLSGWRHGYRKGTMDGSGSGANEVDRVSGRAEVAGPAAIDPADVVSDLTLTEEQKKEIRMGKQAYRKLKEREAIKRRLHQKELDRAESEAFKKHLKDSGLGELRRSKRGFLKSLNRGTREKMSKDADLRADSQVSAVVSRKEAKAAKLRKSRGMNKSSAETNPLGEDV